MSLDSEATQKQSIKIPEVGVGGPKSGISRVEPKQQSVTLRVGFLLVTLFTVLTTAVVVHFPWVWVSKRNSDDFILQLNYEVMSSIKRELNDTMAMAMAHQRVLADLWQSEAVKLQDQRERESMFLSVLKASGYYSFVGIGLSNGDYYGAQRKNPGALVSIESVWDNKDQRAFRNERIFVSDGREYGFVRAINSSNEYNATQRIWYKQAMRYDDQAVLTQAYTFSSTGYPGVNAALQIYTKDHVPVGVVTIALELSRLSDFMSQLRVGKTGTAFMVDEDGHILASKFPIELEQDRGLGNLSLIEDEQQMTIPTIHMVNSPLEKVASQALIESGYTDLKKLTKSWSTQTKVSGKNYVVSADAVGRNNWLLFTVIPADDFSTHADGNTYKVLGFVLIMVVVSCSLATTLGYVGIVKPLIKIIDQTHCIGSYDLSKISKVSSRIKEIHDLSDSLVFMASGLRSFGKYIPTELVKKLLKSGLVAEPYGENRTMSVLFADLVGFTSITEVLGPKIVPHLDRYFETMSEQIEAQLGTIDKFIGDCVMAFWGAPYYFEEHPVRACVAALNCLEKLEELRKQWPEQWSAGLDMRIGVNTGRVVVGNIGSKSRINYTVVGDPVNLASRLESGCKIYGVRCIIGQSTYELAKYDIVARRLDVTHFKGKAEPVVIYELIAMRGKTEVALDYPWIEVYDKALTAFLAGDMVAAKTHFELTIQMRGEDPPSRFFLQRCNQGLSLV